MRIQPPATTRIQPSHDRKGVVQGVSINDQPEFVMERFGRLRDMDRSFDIAYWQRLGPKAIFEAARQMVIDAERQKGRTGELRLQRSVEQFRRSRG